ncbi:hypothetical protein JL722_482 [Aureococcus anophagefferens]|nr:hypothetical protein JL722_482 [Aureococcus anophagefferens]
MRSSAASQSERSGIRVVVRLRPSSGPSTIRVDQEASTLTIPNSRGTSAEKASVVDHTAEGLRFGTGAGKTYTVLGRGGTTATASYDERGLVPRTLQRLFDLAAKKRRAGCSVEIRVSCIEVATSSSSIC